jgi:Archaeal fructose-1,6-bisphosphatase and related enzymes of inositol monophosphatase family
MQPYQGRSPIINVTSNACVFAGKKFLRDFLEIENLQVTKKDTYRFYNNAIINLEKSLRESLLKARPDWPINPSKIENQNDAWIINALSGKANFLHGIPHMAISIASYNNSKLTSGCVYDPLRNELFYSEVGKGAYLNERRIRVSGRSLLNKSLITFNSEEILFEMIQKLKLEGTSIRISGCPSLDLAWVASGRIDACFNTTHIYEDLAGILLIKEAGGFCTDFEMCESNGYKKDICAGNPSIHNKLIKV